MKKLAWVTVFMWVIFSGLAQTPAFPGAEGHGRYVTGGRGGEVYYVTSLNDDINEVGTLRWALNQPSPKNILFKVSGTIYLNSPLRFDKGDLTIAGQTAPGDGICLAYQPVTVNGNNIIVRFLRFRMGDEYVTNPDGADAFEGRRRTNVIIDHCSMSWSTDECASFYGNTNFTMQWCIISESLRLSGHSKGPHGYGGIWGGRNASFHHNLMVHHSSRTPRFGPDTSTQGDEPVDFRNNVIYNWGGEGAYGAEAMDVNIVNNFFKPGPATPNGAKRGRIIAFDKKINQSPGSGFYPINNQWGTLYASGNVVDNSTSSGSDITHCNNATSNNWDYGIYNQVPSKYSITSDEKIAIRRSSPVDAGKVTTHTAAMAYERVLDFAGASLSRDSHDERMVHETRTGTAAYHGLSEFNGLGTVTYENGETINWKSTGYPKGGIIDSHYDIRPDDAPSDWTPWPVLNSLEAPLDSDGDGMPDEWEIANGLDPNDPSDGKLKTLDGNYTNLEVYLNSLVDHIISEKNEGGVGTPTGMSNYMIPKFTIFPNPVIDRFSIVSDLLPVSVEFFNQSGIPVKSYHFNSHTSNTIDVSDLGSGLYFCRVTYENGKFETGKVLKR